MFDFANLTKDQAIEIVNLATSDRIHSFIRGFGCDWDKEAVLDAIEGADQVAWSPHILNHDLAVKTGDRVLHFDISQPDNEEAS